MIASVLITAITSMLIPISDCIRTSLGKDGHYVFETESGEIFDLYPDTKHKSKGLLKSFNQATKSYLFEGDELINEVPIKAALQTMNVLNNKHSYFPYDKLSNKESQEAAKLSALSFYPYYDRTNGIEIGDRFYGGTIEQIIKFNASLTVDLSTHKHAKDIDVGELLAFRWESDDEETSVIVFRGVEYEENWSICFNMKAAEIDLRQFDFDEKFIGLYHSGFYNIMNDYFDVFLPLIESIDLDTHKEIIFSGHSMGSALAQTMSLMLFRHDYADLREELQSNEVALRVQTFEGPIVCDATFATNLEKALNDLNGDGVVDGMQIFDKMDDAVSFEGEESIVFLKNVISHEMNVSLMEFYVRFKMQAGKYNKRMIKDGLDDLTLYVHIGKEIMIDTADELAVGHHAEALNAFFYDLTENGNKGWVI